MKGILDSLVVTTKFTKLDEKQSLAFLKQQFDIQPSHAGLLISGFILLLVVIIDGTIFITSVITFAYPAYFCFISLQSSQPNIHKKYITYMVINTIIQIISNILLILLNPIYYIFVRISITFLLLYPKINLSIVIYDKFINRFIEVQNKPILDQNTHHYLESKKNV